MIWLAFTLLAPLGAADLDGDGKIELAYIDRPHLAKILRIWRFDDGARGAEGRRGDARRAGVVGVEEAGQGLVRLDALGSARHGVAQEALGLLDQQRITRRRDLRRAPAQPPDRATTRV